jgi:hypothetical protein
VARSLAVFEPLRSVFPDQDRVKKIVEDTIKVGNDLLAVKELCASVRNTAGDQTAADDGCLRGTG